MYNKSLKANAALNVIKTVLGMVIPLFTFPYISRVLQVEALGVYSFSASVVSYFTLLANLGIATYAIREGAGCREDRTKLTKLLSEIFSINLVSTLLSYALLFIVIQNARLKPYSTTILILSVQILFSVLGTGWVCDVFEDYLAVAVRNLGVQLLSLAGIFILVKRPEHVNLYAAVLTFSGSLAELLNMLYIRKKYVRLRFTVRLNLRKHLKPILVIFATSIAVSIYVNSDVTMLGLMKDDYQVGLYSTAVKIYNIIKYVFIGMISVLLPRLSSVNNEIRMIQQKDLISKIFSYISVLLLPASIGLCMISKNVLAVIAGIEYEGATSALCLLSGALLLSTYAYAFTQCVILPRKQEKCFLKATVISAIANIGLNFILIPIMGINGTALTTLISELIVFFMMAAASSDQITIREISKENVSAIIGCGGIVVVCLLIKNMCNNTFVCLLTSIFLSAIVYFIVLVLLKNKVVMEILRDILKILKERKP